MNKLRMGGKERLRVFLKGNQDLADLILSRSHGGQVLDQGLSDLILDKTDGACRVDIIQEPSGCSDLVVRDMGSATPAVLREQGLDDVFMKAQFNSRVFSEPDIDLVLFSLHPDVVLSRWRHRGQGYTVGPPSGWEETWSPTQQAWFREEFEPQAPLGPEEFREGLTSFVQEIKDRGGAHIIVLNCSSLDPAAPVYNYHGLDEDTLSVRVHKLNLALMEVSALEGISILDIDRIIAEMGGDEHVSSALQYSPRACQAICREAMVMMDDIGFFEHRPLVMQIGKKSGDQHAVQAGHATR